MSYSIQQIRKACKKCGIAIWADDLIEALNQPTKLSYDDSRVYFEEERARDQRLDCGYVRG